MEVKVKKEVIEFKPFKIELKFETEKEVVNMINLLSATNIEVEYNRCEYIPILFSEFKELKDKLILKLNK